MMVEDATAWLSDSEGYAACTMNVDKAARFRSPTIIRRDWKRYDRMPWWYIFKPDSLTIYRITERKTLTRSVETVETVETEAVT
jgi:hypothetical protein